MDKIRLLPHGLLCAYILNVLIRGCGLPDALVLLGLAGFAAFSEYKQKDQAYQELKQDIADLKAEVTARNQAVDEMRTKIAAMVVSSGMKQIRNG